MERRTFLKIPSAVLGTRLASLADDPMPMSTLGKTGMRVSRFCLGGSHMAQQGQENAVNIVQRAIELGVTFFDSAHLYNQGRSDQFYGVALGGGLRQKVILMSKAEERDAAGAMRQLEETLKRMQTDYLDLWQAHQVSTHKEVDQMLGPNGALETFVKAKQQGKVRHIGFTGHQDPTVHQRLLDAFDGWETVQHPVNPVDPHYLSFIKMVAPRARAKGLGLIAMKTNAAGQISRQNIATVAECLRFALSQDVDVIVSGVPTLEQLEENVLTVKAFRKMTSEEISSLVARTAKGPTGNRVERYKLAPPTAMRTPYRDGEST